MRRMVSKSCENGWTAVVYNRRGHRDKSGIRSTVQEVVDAEVSEWACEVPSPRGTEAVELADIGSGPGTGCVPSPDRQKRPWPMYSDLEDMHEVWQSSLGSASGMHLSRRSSSLVMGRRQRKKLSYCRGL